MGRCAAHTRTMPENRLKRPRDPAQLAKLMIDIASGEVEDQRPTAKRGRAGGLKGGPARASSLDPRKRQQIARKAATARWGKK
jgi:hypothetical protein